MRIFILVYLLVGNFFVNSQSLTNNTNFVETIEIDCKRDNFKFVSIIENGNYVFTSKSNLEINYENLNKQFDRFKFKPTEKKIDYDRLMFNCGILQTRESKDIMISAFKTYILNKYVFSLFMKTEYN